MYTTSIKTEDEKDEITEELYQAIQTIKATCHKHKNCNTCPLNLNTEEYCVVDVLPEIEVITITKKKYQLKED